MLSTKWAGEAAPLLIDDFRRVEEETGFGLRWAIGNAPAELADDGVFDDIAARARDRRYGRGREMLMIALGRMRDPRATDVLIALLDDRDVGGHALLPLGRRRARQARAKIARFLDHEQASVRRDAKRALAMIDAATKMC